MLSDVDSKLQDPKQIADLIYYINFNNNYEMHFDEDMFVPYLFKIIEKGFEIHFLSDRESNGLDKLEWLFEFTMKKYDECERVIQIYSVCSSKSELSGRCIVEMVSQSQNLL